MTRWNSVFDGQCRNGAEVPQLGACSLPTLLGSVEEPRPLAARLRLLSRLSSRRTSSVRSGASDRWLRT